MSDAELQEEEREVLSSIYDGDENFKRIDSDTYQYKYGENESNKSFVLEIKWNEHYPSEIPNINMDTFYNKHICPKLKEKVVDLVSQEAEQYLGMSMTYSLFEFVKEKFEQLIEEQVEVADKLNELDYLTISENDSQEAGKKAPKKEQLSKAQKRRQWNRMDNKGENPRGWDWVDIIKHLSQSGGSKEHQETTSTS